MWALIYKEFVQMRNYLLQLFLAVLLMVLVFGSSLEGFILPYLSVLSVALAMTLPQLLFSMEDRGNTLVYLRSLPVHPRQIVAGKFLFSAIIILALSAIVLAYAGISGQLPAALGRTGPGLVVAAFLLGLSLYLHFRLGTNAAKVALLVSLMACVLLGLALMQQRDLLNAIVSSALLQNALGLLGSWWGILLGLVIAAAILQLAYLASAAVFTRQDASRMP